MTNVADKSESTSLLNARWYGTVNEGGRAFRVAVVQEQLGYVPLVWGDNWDTVVPEFGIKIMSAWGASLDLRSVGQAETIDLRVEGAAEIAAASEALATVEEHVRRALCDVLRRLGADGATAFINGDSPEKVSDAIYGHVRELEARALVSSAEPDYECDAICPPPALAEGARCHIKGPHVTHVAVNKFTTGWPDHLTRERVKK